MKQHLVNFLLEEYKQQRLFEELEKKGIDLNGIMVNNLDIVLDIIGFPKDNSDEYDVLTFEDEDFVPRLGRKRADKDLFQREWLYDRHYEVFTRLATDEKVSIGEKGLEIEPGAEETVVREEFLKLIDWLYVEFQAYDTGRL